MSLKTQNKNIRHYVSKVTTQVNEVPNDEFISKDTQKQGENDWILVKKKVKKPFSINIRKPSPLYDNEDDYYNSETKYLKRFKSKHHNYDARVSKPVLYGDSDISRWSKRNFDSTVVGVGGARMVDIASYAERFVKKYNPSIVILTGGGCDLLRGETPDITFEYFILCIKELRKNYKTLPIVYMSTKPEPASLRIHCKFREYEMKISKYLNELNDKYIFYIDNSNMRDRNLYRRDDNMHLNKLGYELWNTKIDDVIFKINQLVSNDKIFEKLQITQVSTLYESIDTPKSSNHSCI